MVEKENSETTLSIEATRLWVDNAIEKVLNDWKNSDEEINSPREFKFANGTIDSISKKSAAGAIRKAINKGETYIYIQSSPLPEDEDYLVGFKKFPEGENAELLVGIIPSDFVKRVRENEKDPIEVFEMFLEDLVLCDIEAASTKRKRAFYKRQS
jgi:hypothetical protein